MINNPDWHKPKEKSYLHQISLDCIEKLAECIELFNNGEISADTTFKLQKKVLIDEIDDDEFLGFTIENFSDMMRYVAIGDFDIRIHSDIAGEMWFGVG